MMLHFAAERKPSGLMMQSIGNSLFARQPAIVRSPAETPKELRCDDEVCTAQSKLLDGTTDMLLGLSSRVRFSSVDHVNAILESNFDDFL